ncbi:MAG: hypothetical protein JNL12_01250 [Planctomycetes bacterium]|nr:hypothetical protein [Planctomycetota bacterium]
MAIDIRTLQRLWILIFGCSGVALPSPRAQAPAPTAVVVVEVVVDSARAEQRGFTAVAKRAATFHRATVLRWNGEDGAVLAGLLREAGAPTNVLLVVPPAEFDVMLHRRTLLALMQLDSDPFVDASFGWITARDGAAVEALWERIERLHRDGPKSKVWHSIAVASNMKSAVYAGHRSDLEKAAGFTGDSVYLGTVEHDEDVLAFFDRFAPELGRAAVVEWSGNGDPQGIWLFGDRRNLDRTKHWPYDPQKVGHDPNGEMPRLGADRIRRLALDGAVVWSGTCHAGATHRVYVEADIVSTFGSAEPGTVHRLQPDESLGLAMLDAGAASFAASVGPNHGMSGMRETEFALRNGASLGEALKSTYDDVVLAAGGLPKLDLLVAGELVAAGERIMQGGGCNRALFGDPTLRPFAATRDPRETVVVREGRDGGLEIEVRRVEGFHATAWDMYGDDRQGGHQIQVRVPLSDSEGDSEPAPLAEVRIVAAGRVVPGVVVACVVERFAGLRFLHLKATAARTALDGKATTATFVVRQRS